MSDANTSSAADDTFTGLAPTYAAPPVVIHPPTADDLAVAESRKLVLRALDSKLSQQDDAAAAAAIELATKLASNIVQNPDEPKYRRFKASNPAISKKLLKQPGGVDLVLAMGFRTVVFEMEEHWTADGSELQRRKLGEALEVLAHYAGVVRARAAAKESARAAKLSGMSEERERALRDIQGDREDRKDKVWVRPSENKAPPGASMGIARDGDRAFQGDRNPHVGSSANPHGK